ncbi:hypothetical protein [Xenophilus azovorans]|uniref:hypothetical protein n=1 Tax=Xenophilus azovorans TaxID=151755 RepID=UPI0012EE23CF|nr:hypothetical protein [Xenophilus azovorans]
MNDPAISPEAQVLAGEVLAKMALGAAGQPFPDEPEYFEAADAAAPEVVSLGPVRFKIIDDDARPLAQELGAIDPEHPEATALLVEAEDPQALTTGRYVTVEAAPGVALVYLIYIAHADLNDPAAPDYGPEAFRLPALDAIRLHPGRALLVQVFAEDEEAAGQSDARQQALAALQSVVLHLMNSMGKGEIAFDPDEATALRLALDGDLNMPVLQRLAERNAELAGALARVVDAVEGAA